MAKLIADVQFTGSLQHLTAYKRKDLDTIILRTKYGPSKEAIATKPSYETTRRLNKEFGGRSTTCRWIRKALQPLLPLADYNIAATLNALLKPIQELDTQSAFGQRHVQLSHNQRLLEGFPLNRRLTLDALTPNPFTFTLDRATLKATVALPALLPGLSFFPVGSFGAYRLTAALGVVPDLFFATPRYQPLSNFEPCYPVNVQTPWYPVQSASGPMVLQLSLPYQPAGTAFSLVLSAGVQFGGVGAGGAYGPVKGAGSAKVLAIR